MEDIEFEGSTDSQDSAQISIVKKYLKETLKLYSMLSAPSFPNHQYLTISTQFYLLLQSFHNII